MHAQRQSISTRRQNRQGLVPVSELNDDGSYTLPRYRRGKGPSPIVTRVPPVVLNDDLSDLFGAGLGTGRKVIAQANAKFTNPAHVLELAVEIEAERKAEAKALAAENRAIKSAERKAIKAAELEAAIARGEAKTKRTRSTKPKPRVAVAADQGTPPVASRPSIDMVVLQGRQIPNLVEGEIEITGQIQAKTGTALVLDIRGQNHIARGVVVWAGQMQDMVRDLVAHGVTAEITVRQPDNDRFRPSVGSVKAA